MWLFSGSFVELPPIFRYRRYNMLLMSIWVAYVEPKPQIWLKSIISQIQLIKMQSMISFYMKLSTSSQKKVLNHFRTKNRDFKINHTKMSHRLRVKVFKQIPRLFSLSSSDTEFSFRPLRLLDKEHSSMTLIADYKVLCYILKLILR